MNNECIISPNLTGGIGNQLFEIAAAYSFSLTNKCKLIINDINTKNIGKGHQKQNISNKYKNIPDSICNIFPNIQCDKSNIIINWNEIVKQKRGYYYENIPLSIYVRKNKKTKLVGVFSAYSYFKEHKDEISKLFEFSPIIKNITYNNFKKIIDYDKTISLHFRRGDIYKKYMKKRKFWCVVDISYYYEAINKFYKMVNNDKEYVVIIFNEEDDDKWIKQYIIPFLNKMKIKYIHIHYDVPSIISLYLISCCKNNIISNSTFSFWGAFLNKNPKKIVFVPQVWTTIKNPYQMAMQLRGSILSTSTDERLPKEWIKIETECIKP